MTDLQQLLDSGGAIVADGGMGTMLFSAGLAHGSAPELWNIERPDEVQRIHTAYVEAGAQIILTNTFGGNRVRLGRHNLRERVAELNTAGAKLARAAADAAEHAVVVGGSIGPTGEMMQPLGVLGYEEVVEIFAEQAQALLAGGVNVFWIETMADLEEVRAAVEGCRQASADLPIVSTMTFDTKGRTMMGVKPEQAAEQLRALGVLALGANCGNGPDEIQTVVEHMHGHHPDALLIAKANAGLPHMHDGRAVYDATPEDMAAYARVALANGARIVGACCGSTPAHIQAIAQVIKERAL
jgi:5-methyltetrahydrofolate--homocysteine methyltransferase